MTSGLLIEVISVVVSFALGALLGWFTRRSEDHIGPHHQGEAPVIYPKPLVAVSPLELSAETKAQLADEAKKDYFAALDQSAEQFSHDLTGTSGIINSQIKNLSTQIIATELEEYRSGLVKLREEAVATMKDVQGAVEQERQAQEAQLAKDIQAERQQLLEQMDTKLGDAISSFLVETLQHNVDLGAQTNYLMAMLEEHKDELKKEVTDEA